METDNIKFLPLFTLNQLADRVIMKIDHISSFYHADTIWDDIIGECQIIEDEPRSVNTIILHAKKDSRIVFSDNNIYTHHVKLLLVYTLLYYKHRNDAIYQAIVFPELISNMGYYKDEKILKVKIKQEIDKIIEHDKLLEQKNMISSDQNLNGSPPSQPLPLKSNNLKTLRKQFIQGLNANLVNIDKIDWADVTIGFDRSALTDFFWGIEDDEVLEDVVNKIIERWNELSVTNDSRCMKKSDKRGFLPTEPDPMMFGGTYQECIDSFFKTLWVERKARNTYSSVMNDEYHHHANKNENKIHIKSLQSRIKELEHELAEALSMPDEVTANQKVRMELACRLLEKAGVDKSVLSRYGNKDKVGTLIGLLLDITPATCKVYVSQRDVSRRNNNETISKLNALLNELGIDIQL